MVKRTRDVCVVGLGPVGLATAVCFASKGLRVVGVEKDKERLEGLQRGRPSFSEDGMGEMLIGTLGTGILELTSDISGAVGQSAMIFITVGTPARSDGAIDLSQVTSASTSIGAAMRGSTGKVVVVKSTVVPGTARGLVRPIIKKESGRTDFGVASNPEFLREGNMIGDTMEPSRVVIGSDDGYGEKLVNLYSKFYKDGSPPMVVTNTVNAEMIKYASNAVLAAKVSFINEIANLCGTIPGADIAKVVEGMSYDKRIGGQFLNAGLGFGGSCFPKDIQALIALGKSKGVGLPVVEGTLKTNTSQAFEAVSLAKRLLGSVKEKRMALLGLSFKPGTDDMRGSVAVPLIRKLLREGSQVIVYDPEATPNARKLFGRSVEYAATVERCLEGADCCIVTTEWDEFKKLKPADFLGMRNKALVDGRRVFLPDDFEGTMKFAAVGYGNAPP